MDIKCQPKSQKKRALSTKINEESKQSFRKAMMQLLKLLKKLAKISYCAIIINLHADKSHNI